MNVELNKIYYYLVCLIAFFVLLWGAIDLTSAGFSYVSTGSISATTSDQNMEDFYQKRVARDRVVDSLARIAISGIVFLYCRKKVS
jgi:hypothetical protein